MGAVIISGRTAFPGAEEGLVDISCKVGHNSNQIIANGVNTTLNFDIEDYDTDTMHDTVTNNERITTSMTMACQAP